MPKLRLSINKLTKKTKHYLKNKILLKSKYYVFWVMKWFQKMKMFLSQSC